MQSASRAAEPARGPDLAGDVCKKADTCDALSGITAAQCKNVIDTSLAAMPGAARSDAETAYRACLGMADCDDFNACIVGVMQGRAPAPAAAGPAAARSARHRRQRGRRQRRHAAAGTGGSAVGGSAGGRPVTTAAAAGAVGGTGGGSVAGRGGSCGGGSGRRHRRRQHGRRQAAGSTGTGGAQPAAPELMTSAQNAYWMTGTVTKVASGTADLNVDKNTTYQHWDGFGGCFNEMGWDALSVLSADQVTSAMKLLFDATDGANFVYGRLPMGASDYATSWYTLDDTRGATTRWRASPSTAIGRS